MVFIISVLIIILDQFTKHRAMLHLMNKRPYVVIKDFVQFHYVENRGAAFGILQDKKVFFVIITVVALIIASYYLIANYHELNKLTRIGVALLIAGAVGNLIDRIRLGYVIDFISVRLINAYDFPVFNIADISIVIGTVIIMILVLFDKYKVV